GITWTQLLALWALAVHDPPLSASQLIRWLGLSKSMTTILVDGLVRPGWVVRRLVPQDRRRADLVLTPTGRALLGACQPVVQEALTTLFGGTAPADLVRWHRGLAQLVAVLRSGEPPTTGD